MKHLLLCSLLILLLTAATVTAVGDDFDKMIIRDMPSEKIIEKYGRMPGQLLTAEDLAALYDSYFDGDTLILLVIPVEWDGRPGTYSPEDIEQLLFSRDEIPGGSVADYFHEVSYGQVAVTGEVLDWYNAGTYDPDVPYDYFVGLLDALDPFIDFTQYDGNGDAAVDAICFLRSGNGEEDSGDPNDIWSYAMSWVYGWGPYDGMRVTHWNTSPETWPLRNPDNPTEFSGETTLNRIRVICHELAHNFGLPDLYDYDDKLDVTTYFTPNDGNDHPLVDWCLMGYGGYGIFSIGSVIPSHLCGWNKNRIGWIEPIVLEGEFNDLVLYNIETNTDSALYKIPMTRKNGTDVGEYFLLEYRNPQSSARFDKIDSDFSCYFWPDLSFGGDPLDCGLLITHVHDSLIDPYDDYRMNDGKPHYAVIVEDAGYNPDRDMYSNPEGRLTDSAQWWYPYETRRGALFSPDVDGQNEFGPNTVPSSSSYYGKTDIYVRVDSIVGERLYLYVNNPPEPVCYDSDDDGYGDPGHPENTCPDDNCPTVYNPHQVDTDGDGIGDACEGAYVCGDANGDGNVTSLDAMFLIEYIHKGGPAPEPIEAGDANGDGTVDADDIRYLTDYLHKDGPEPICP